MNPSCQRSCLSVCKPNLMVVRQLSLDGADRTRSTHCGASSSVSADDDDCQRIEGALGEVRLLPMSELQASELQRVENRTRVSRAPRPTADARQLAAAIP